MTPKRKLFIRTFLAFLFIGFFPILTLTYIRDKIYPWTMITKTPIVAILFVIVIFGISYYIVYDTYKDKKIKDKKDRCEENET
ncbi:MAG: hypothetical protein LBG80_17615 [Bacteroidales bacterium]|nr:hypothetical protein [Bacteroidales bacterium]